LTPLDIDADGITDIDEMDPWNSMTESVQDYVAEYGDNETMMESQFNTIMRENVPPVLLNVKIKKHDDWGTCWAGIIPFPCPKNPWTEIEVEALDVAEFEVEIMLEGASRRSLTLEGKGHEWFDVKLDLDPVEVLFSYKVVISMEDFAGNKLDPPYEEEIDGLFGGVLRMLEALWDFLVSVACAIADLIAKALSWLADIIIGIMKAIMEAVLDAIKYAVEGYANSLIDVVSSHFTWYNPIDAAYGDAFNAGSTLFDFTILPITVISAILNLLTVLDALSAVMSGGLTTVIGYVAEYIIPVILSTIVGMLIVEGLLMAVTPAFEVAIEFMGGWGTYYSFTAAVVAAMTTFFARSKDTSRYTRAASYALMGILMAMLSVLAPHGWIVLFLDGIAMSLAIVAMWDMISNWDEKITGAIGKIVSAFSKATVIAGIVSVPLSIGAHGLSGEYDKGF
jgi:hypothetical protein